MENNLKDLIKINAFLGFDFIFSYEIGYIKCPNVESVQSNLLLYLYLVNKYTQLYEDEKEDFFNIVLQNNEYRSEFGALLYYFIPTEEIRFLDNKFVYHEGNFIDNTNFSLFMDTVRVLHHFDKKDDDYKPANKIAAEMMKRAKKLKKELEQKQRQKNGIGFLEIMSTVCGRHHSISPDNIRKLNYYQIVDQYKRLLKIDEYTPCLYGNATEDYIKKNNITHYSMPINNE